MCYAALSFFQTWPGPLGARRPFLWVEAGELSPSSGASRLAGNRNRPAPPAGACPGPQRQSPEHRPRRLRSAAPAREGRPLVNGTAYESIAEATAQHGGPRNRASPGAKRWAETDRSCYPPGLCRGLPLDRRALPARFVSAIISSLYTVAYRCPAFHRLQPSVVTMAISTHWARFARRNPAELGGIRIPQAEDSAVFRAISAVGRAGLVRLTTDSR